MPPRPVAAALLAALLLLSAEAVDPVLVSTTEEFGVAILRPAEFIIITSHNIDLSAYPTQSVFNLNLAMWGNCSEPLDPALVASLNVPQDYIRPNMCSMVFPTEPLGVTDGRMWASNLLLRNFTSIAFSNSFWMVDSVIASSDSMPAPAILARAANVTLIGTAVVGPSGHQILIEPWDGTDSTSLVLVDCYLHSAVIMSGYTCEQTYSRTSPQSIQNVVLARNTFYTLNASQPGGLTLDYVAGGATPKPTLYTDNAAQLLPALGYCGCSCRTVDCSCQTCVNASCQCGACGVVQAGLPGGGLDALNWSALQPTDDIIAWQQSLIQAGVTGAAAQTFDPLGIAPSPPPVAVDAPFLPQPAPSKRSKVGLIVGICAGAIALLAIVVAFFVMRRRANKRSNIPLGVIVEDPTDKTTSDKIGSSSVRPSGDFDPDACKGLDLFGVTYENSSQIAAQRRAAEEAIARGTYNVPAVLDYIFVSCSGDLDGKYWLDRTARQGRGGQATVVMGKAKHNQAPVAVKFFVEHSTFLQELAVYQTLAASDPVAHDFIRDAQDHSVKGTVLPGGLKMPSYLVMKKGMSMHDWVRNRRPPPLMGLWMLGEVCHQVHLLHESGLVHRDLKPANVLWVQDDNAWHVIDFGCTVKEGTTVSPAFTLRYAPPEAVTLAGKPIVATRSMDVWALGVMAYEMLSGHFIIPIGTSTGDMYKILRGEQPFQHEQDPKLWLRIGKLRTVVQAMLNRDPTMRPPVSEILRRLDNLAMTTAATHGASSRTVPAMTNPLAAPHNDPTATCFQTIFE